MIYTEIVVTLSALILIAGVVVGIIAYRSMKLKIWYLTSLVETLSEDAIVSKKQLETAGRVLGIFEDELQVIQKRKEREQNLKTRFTPRTPR